MKKLVFLLFLSITLVSLKAGVVEPKFDHSAWDRLLRKHVSDNGNVDYDGFKADRSQLNSYLKSLEANPPQSDWGKNETMAYWINAYNAFTVDLILRNYPLKSIMEINNGKAWDLQFISIGGKKYSLNNIEHDILRKRYQDARIHFAVNCASVSCPKLNNSAFVAEGLDGQLENMAKHFVNNSSKNSISSGSVTISKLFDWYKEDFTRSGSVIDYLNKYSTTKINESASVSFKEYNWNLNK